MAASQSPQFDIPGSFRFEFDSANKILLVRLAGTVTPQLVADLYHDLRHHWIATGARADIVDVSGVTQILLDSEMIRGLARRDPLPEIGEHPTALVAPHPETFGLARMFQMTAESKRPLVHAVRSMHEAFSVLSVQSPHFEPLPDLRAGS